MTRLLHIVVIDDNISDLILAQEVFNTFNDLVSVTTYQSGKTALEALRRPDAVPPDVVLLDINMPQMNGFDVLKVMKADDQLRLIPVVMLTTSVAANDITQAYSLFASSYVAKSMEFEEFLRQLECFVGLWTNNRLHNWPTSRPIQVTSAVRIRE